MSPADYQVWLSGGSSGGTMAEAGAKLFSDFACVSCHTDTAQGRGPVLRGAYGKPVLLEDGRTVTADENYIRESIVAPTAKIVHGFKPIMPTFQGQISDEQLNALVAYVKSLGQSQSTETGGKSMAAATPQPQ